MLAPIPMSLDHMRTTTQRWWLDQYRRACVYVCERDGEVVYVGSTLNVDLAHRRIVHRNQSEWWTDDVTMRVLVVTHVAHARWLEARLIRRLRPYNNRHHNPDWTKKWRGGWVRREAVAA